MAFDATLGGASATSYIPVATADTIMADTTGRTAWASLTTDQKQDALMTATARLEQERWKGDKADTTTPQRLKWPRSNVLDEEGDEYDDDDMPLPLQYATAELAYYISQNSDFLDPTGLERFKRLKAGKVEIEPRHIEFAGALPANVARWIRPLLLFAGARIVRS